MMTKQTMKESRARELLIDLGHIIILKSTCKLSLKKHFKVEELD
jgi:hypothetical protein